MAKHKPQKSEPTEYTTDDEDMITYDVESEELEDKFAMKECFIQNPDKYIRALTPTRFRKCKSDLDDVVTTVLLEKPTERNSIVIVVKDIPLIMSKMIMSIWNM
ncbi:hypothetical protein TNCV_341111 [Trichonephila clavipes]|uniref:Uncharacterized protein n=1 Tax=Trichonephila clavipes TaxID=2585209 RepID=A0A8X6SVE2_TRICX|nr:hypothetical protein TNCV_341111 [Trichonephila clavipes]